jgi:predicted ribosome quality control (RQC) complex YloA/Tae2 family protein
MVSVFLERAYKKRTIQEQDILKTESREKYKKYGELLQAYAYNIQQGHTSVTVPDFYDGDKEIEIPLKSDLTPQENANAYFKRYNKLKRTFEAASEQLVETNAEIAELEGIALSLDLAENEEDLSRIRHELSEAGIIHSKTNEKKVQLSSPPLKFLSSDGFEILVGKNNYQNDEITFKMSEPSDWWFHAKDIAGSHVLMKTKGLKTDEIPDRAFEEAASLAAKFSKGARGDKVEVDYIQKKEVKKPAGAKPGFVVYYTNFSMMAGTDISGLSQVE